MQTYYHAPVVRLVGSILELEGDINEMQAYLSKPVAGSDTVSLPLGMIGKILGQQLQTEGKVLAADAELLQSQHVHGWELAKHSAALQKKVLLLVTLTGVIAQLPSVDALSQASIRLFAQRVGEQCHRVEHAIEAVTAAAAVGSPAGLSVLH